LTWGNDRNVNYIGAVSNQRENCSAAITIHSEPLHFARITFNIRLGNEADDLK